MGWGRVRERERLWVKEFIFVEYWYSMEEDVYCVFNRWFLIFLCRRRLFDVNEF